MTSSQINLLVVDDAPQIQRLLRTGLSSQRFHITKATTAADALALAFTDECDLMLLDLGLPDRGGLEVVEEVRRSSALPIIILSALDDEASTVKAFELGADDY